MSKPQHIQLSIPNPCTQDWDEMTPEAKGRHCAHCQKTVIDFTGWSDTALYNYFANQSGNVCGRFTGAQLNRTIDIPCQPHSRLYRLTIALGLTLTLSPALHTYAQNRPPWLPAHCVMPQRKPALSHPTDSLDGQLCGKILDDKNEGLPSAVVQVLNDSVIVGGAVSDYNGSYLIKGLLPGYYSLLFQYPGFVSKKLTDVLIIKDEITQQNIQFVYPVRMEAGSLGGCVVITSYTTPLIDLDNPTKRTFTREQIDHMPH